MNIRSILILSLAVLLSVAGTTGTATAQPESGNEELEDTRQQLPPAVAQNFETRRYGFVQGAVQQTNGAFQDEELRVIGTHEDRNFKWWVGETDDDRYVLYDAYNNVWWNAGVRYIRAEIRFQDETREGFYRGFDCEAGNDNRYQRNSMGCKHVDPHFFFGKDGHVYRKISITRFIGRQGSGPQGNRRRLNYPPYFIDLESGERSRNLRRIPEGYIKIAERRALYRLSQGGSDTEGLSTWSDTYKSVRGESDGKQAPKIDEDGPDEEEQALIRELQRQLRDEDQ